MTADRARGALAVLQDADGKFLCEVPCGYIVEQTASAHKPRRIQAQRRRRAMLRRRVALTVAVLTVAALLAALMPWSGSGAADKPKDTTAGTLEEVHQPTAVLLPSSGTVAEYVPNAAEVEALAKLIYGEAGIVPSTTEQAAVAWCVLNRVDDPRFPDTVLEVIEAPYQFSGYDPEYPVKEEFALLAADVLTRYRAELDGEENVGRVLPAEYCFFTGDGRRNHFTTEWKSTDCFGWTLESPYTDCKERHTMKENKSGWQFPKALEIIKCKEGSKEFMKERPARRPFGNTVLICEYPIDDTAAEEPNAKLITWRLAKRAARDFLRVSFMPSAIVSAATHGGKNAVRVYGKY